MKNYLFLKCTILFLTAFLFQMRHAYAQIPVSIVIGNTSGPASPNFGPINNGGALDQIYSRSAYIYTAAELGIPSGAKIVKLEWLKNTGGTVPGPNKLNIWMDNTAASAFPAMLQWNALINGATQTYSNSSFTLLQGNNTYVDAPFNVPGSDSFVYTGSNLKILTDWQQGSAGGTVFFYYQSAPGKAIGIRKSVSTPPLGTTFLTATSFGNARPTIRITYITVPSCSGAPVTGPALAYVSAACSGMPFTLSVQNPVAAGGVSYQWQSASDSLFTAGLTSLGATSSISAIQTTPTYYRCVVTCTGSGLSYTTPFVYVPMSVHYLCYCVSAPTVSTDEDILNVTFGTLNNTSTCSAISTSAGSMQNQYTNFQYVAAPMVAKSSTVPYSIQVGTCGFNSYANRTVIFIDYNHNGVFEVSEMADTSSGTSLGPNTVTGYISIPPYALDGLTGMRVMVSQQGGPFNLSTIQCSTSSPYNWGETEDYLVNVITPVPCVGMPYPGNTLASANPVCLGTIVNLSLQSPPLSLGTTFQWYKNNIPITGATNNYYAATITAADSFYCLVTCTGSGLSASSSTLGIGLIPFLNCYCTSSATHEADEDIYNVTVNGSSTNPLYANGNSCLFFGPPAPGPGSVVGQYANFLTSGNFTTITQGTTVPFEIRVNECDGAPYYPNGVGIWIDYNHNGSFSDAGEAVFVESTASSATGASPAGDKLVIGSFVVPVNALIGQTAMRVIDIEGIAGPPLTISPCLAYPFGETEDYLITINSPGSHDPAISAISAPIGNNCAGANESISATVCNYGSLPIDLTVHPIYITYKVNGPTGLIIYLDTLDTGILPVAGTLCLTSNVGGVNMFAGGNYTINAVVSCPGIANNFVTNDSLANPITIYNYRPQGSPPYVLCQNGSIPLGQGLSVNGCPPTYIDSMTLTFAVSLCNDNIGATAVGNVTNAHCADMYACTFATLPIPSLPTGVTFIQPGKLTITNLSKIGNPAVVANDQVRMNLFSTAPVGATLFSPAGNVSCVVPGGTQTDYDYQRDISIAQLTNLFSSMAVGAPLHIGYWEAFNNNISIPDITTDAGGDTTVATLKIYYQSGSAGSAWYDVPAGGSSLFPLSTFNPLFVSNALLNNAATPGTYTFYAACSSDSNCRVPVDLVIQAGPTVFQDSLLMCESAVSANEAIFDLTTLNGPVSGNIPGVTVSYFGDQSLLSPILNPSVYLSSTNFIYSKVVDIATGCYSTDSVYLEVSSLPQFSLPIYFDFICTPDVIDISSIISVFSQTSIDTFYYSNPTFSSLFSNPHAIAVTDTVFMIVKTVNSAACADTATAYINVSQSTASVQNVTASAAYTWNVNGQSYTVSGTYIQTSVNASGCLHSDTLHLIVGSLTVSIKCFIEGYWNGLGGMFPVLLNQFEPTTVNACDTIDIELRNSNPPFSVVASTRSVLNQDGTASGSLSGPPGNYYIAVKHRNALMTWSANPVSVGPVPSVYDFTLASNKAYGNNMTEVASGIWAFYSGEINQDENIDLLDLSVVQNDIQLFNYGYLATDINGDGNVDLLDSPLLESNINNFVFSYHP